MGSIPIEVLAFLAALGLGLTIGYEREIHAYKKEHPVVAGIRTFTIVSILGYFIAFNFRNTELIYFSGIGIVFCIFIATLFIKQKLKDPGMTTAVSLILIFLLGIFTGMGYLFEPLFIGAAIFTLNTSKKRLHYFAGILDEKELMSALRFLSVIAIFIPLAYTVGTIHPLIGPGRVFDTIRFLLMVVFVSTISFVSYLITKVIGTSKGLKISAFFGGFVSSAASTASMSEKFKKNPHIISTIYSSILLTNTSMFLKNFIIIFTMAGLTLSKLFIGPVLLFLMISLIFVMRYSGEGKKEFHKIEVGTPFGIIPAAKFALLYLMISVFTYFAKNYLGVIGVYASSIGGLVSTTSVTASMASLYAAGEIGGGTALTTLLLSILFGTISKVIIVRTYDKDLSKKIAVPFSILSLIILITAVITTY